jgi:hypothetical protein
MHREEFKKYNLQISRSSLPYSTSGFRGFSDVISFLDQYHMVDAAQVNQIIEEYKVTAINALNENFNVIMGQVE